MEHEIEKLRATISEKNKKIDKQNKKIDMLEATNTKLMKQNAAGRVQRKGRNILVTDF